MLKVNEIFYSIQGEGKFTGTPSVFIRLQGCEVGCAWCDTKHTWDTIEATKVNLDAMLGKTNDNSQWAEMTEVDIVDRVNELADDYCHVVITGGEPLSQNIDELIKSLLGHSVQIETSGTEEISYNAHSAWVTISPKLNMNKPIIPDVLFYANEIKMPIGKQDDIDNLKELINKYNLKDKRIWLQPISENKKSIDLCIISAKENNWKLSMQAHKYIGVR